MELVYLWVEDYKNIKNQGFNFSPRFECEFKAEYEKDENGEEKLKDNCELIIEDKQKYYFHIFPENINVTAIVGKNGSGKSSLINVLLKGNSNIKRILVFKIDDTAKFISNIENIDTDIQKITQGDTPFKFSTLHYDLLIRDFTNGWHSFFFRDRTFNHHLLQNLYIDANTKIDLYKYLQIINTLIIKYAYLNNIFSYSAKYFQMINTSGRVKSFLNMHKEQLTNIGLKTKNDSSNTFSMHDVLLDILHNNETNQIKLLIYIVIYIFTKYPDISETIEKDFANRIANSFDNVIAEIKSIANQQSLLNMQNLLNNFDICIEILNNSEIFNKKIEISTNELLKENISIINELILIDFIKIDFYDDTDRKFKDLSHGERHIYSNSLLIYDAITKSDKNNFVMCLDEPDNTLHPEWQKRLIWQLISAFKNCGKNIHFIISSHSPFILSDIPTQNVIFLDQDENGNCKVIDGLKDKKQTFGANIHTLLSDAFFMEDGLIGEFAKEKINKAIELLNQKELSKEEIEYCENIISIIGEPIIKRQLQKMLDSKRLSKIDKISEIENQIAKMQEELNILKAKQNG